MSDRTYHPEEHYITVAGEEYSYSVRRSRRAKYLALHVGIEGIELVLPERLAWKHAEQFMQERAQWLAIRVNKYQQLRREMPRRQLATGEKLPVFGADYYLKVTVEPDRRRARVQTAGSLLAVRLALRRDVRSVVERWYRHQAQQYFDTVTKELAQKLGVQVRQMRIGNHRSQWGSCGADGRLSFNWRLALAPERIARYVAIHEVCHLVHHNHSAAFWRLVAQIDPDFEQHRRWLARNEHRLVL